MENTEKFLAEGQLQKLEGQLYPVCEKHCPQSLNCSRGTLIECPVQVYIEHLRRHTRSSVYVKMKKVPSTDMEHEHSMMLRNELAMSGYGRIKAKLRKISMITEKTISAGHGNPKQSLREVRNLLEELHEFDTMIRDVDNMIVRAYLYTCLDRISEKCRNFEEDMRWALSEKAREEMDEII
jgi:hypothetical protein